MGSKFDKLRKKRDKFWALGNAINERMYPKREPNDIKVAESPTFCEISHNKIAVTFKCPECGQAVVTFVDVKRKG